MSDGRHGERAHALLSASGSSRWINCPPSARLEEKFPEEPPSDYALEGTLAHEFGDVGLQRCVSKITPGDHIIKLGPLRQSEYYTDEMEDHVLKYIDYVVSQYEEAKKKTEDAILLIEEQIDLTEYIEEGFGTNDSVIIADDIMEVIDLKYGQGIQVSAEDNPQLKLYGLGSLQNAILMYGIKTVKLTIVQPRLDWISSWEISAKDLIKWGEKVVKPTAKIAFAGEGKQKAGDHCKWCKAKAKCRVLADDNLELTKYDFQDPQLLEDNEILEIYVKEKRFTDWLNSINAYVLSKAIEGKKWEGYKVVEGRRNRSWADLEKVIVKLQDNAYSDEDIFKARQLRGIGDIEKLVGKKDFPEFMGDLVIKKAGKPTLAFDTDERPLADGLSQAKKDFDD